MRLWPSSTLELTIVSPEDVGDLVGDPSCAVETEPRCPYNRLDFTMKPLGLDTAIVRYGRLCHRQ